MTETRLMVTENEPLTETVYRMTLLGSGLPRHNPGQFINLLLDGLYLRRPISVCDQNGGILRIVYKVVGQGTGQMSRMKPGDTVNALVGLGNGYDLSRAGERNLLLGGGVGIPPLYLLAQRLLEEGRQVMAVLGFGTRDEVFGERDFLDLGCGVTVATADGSYGRKGFVTDVLPAEYDYFFACGPVPMLRAVSRKTATGGQMSFEQRMGCGFGACMGCSQKVRLPGGETGWKRICREGPVLDKEEVLWED